MLLTDIVSDGVKRKCNGFKTLKVLFLRLDNGPYFFGARPTELGEFGCCDASLKFISLIACLFLFVCL